MTSIRTISWFVSFASLGLGIVASADDVTAPQVDPHPYQSQIILRSSGSGLLSGELQVVASQAIPKYTYKPSGATDIRSEYNTVLMHARITPMGDTQTIGANYIFDKEGFMATISADGSMIFKDKPALRPVVAGGVYFTDAISQSVVMVDSFGCYSIISASIPKALPQIAVAGGNYFVDQQNVLTTFKSMGVAMCDGTGMMTKFSLNPLPRNVAIAGGNYFVLDNGDLYTVSSKTGLFFNVPKDQITTTVRYPGGNYFIGNDGILYTVLADGTVRKNSLSVCKAPSGVCKTSAEYVLEDYVVSQSPLIRGYSFMEFADGSFILIDGEGVPHSRLMHVSSNDQSANPWIKLPTNLDLRSVYFPKILH